MVARIQVSGVRFAATQAPSVYDKVIAMEPILRPVVSLNLTMYVTFGAEMRTVTTLQKYVIMI